MKIFLSENVLCIFCQIFFHLIFCSWYFIFSIIFSFFSSPSFFFVKYNSTKVSDLFSEKTVLSWYPFSLNEMMKTSPFTQVFRFWTFGLFSHKGTNNTRIRLRWFLHCKLTEFDPSTLHPFLPFTIFCSPFTIIFCSPFHYLLFFLSFPWMITIIMQIRMQVDQNMQIKNSKNVSVYGLEYVKVSVQWNPAYYYIREERRKREKETVRLFRDDNMTNDSKGSFKRTNNDLLWKCILLQILFANHVCPFQGLNE